MASKADFYVGRGPGAEWLGSLEWDGMPVGIIIEIREATDEQVYRDAVMRFLNRRPDAHFPETGWPWKWDTSLATNYAYAFDKGRVFASCFGSSWWKADAEEPDHKTLTAKAARFPYMGGHRIEAEGE